MIRVKVWRFRPQFKRVYFVVLSIDLDSDLKPNHIFGLDMLSIIENLYWIHISSMQSLVDYCWIFRNSSKNEALLIGIASYSIGLLPWMMVG